MQLLDKIEKKYGSLNTEWVVPDGKVTEVKMIKELALSLKSCTDQLNRTIESLNDCRREVRLLKGELAEKDGEIGKVALQERRRLMDDIRKFLDNNEV